MSLDVYLIDSEQHPRPASSGIFIREGGKNLEITEEEWYKRHPNREPIRVSHASDETDELYHDNITSNLGQMASHAGLYDALWQPDTRGWTHAHDIILVLRAGLQALQRDPELYKQYDADNGWGTYEQFVPFVIEYLEACQKWPDARIEVSR